jgi:CheY-like chemotaxis protein
MRTILLVEDNDDDVFAMKRALKGARIQNPLQLVTDGKETVLYLSGAEPYADRTKYPLPFLLFLDLKLPYIDGLDVLSWIRNQRSLDSMAVVVLTGSAHSRDERAAQNLGAISYLVKPPTPQSLLDVLETLKSQWTTAGSQSPLQFAAVT